MKSAAGPGGGWRSAEQRLRGEYSDWERLTGLANAVNSKQDRTQEHQMSCQERKMQGGTSLEGGSKVEQIRKKS